MRPEPQLSFSDFALRMNGFLVNAGIDSIKSISEEVSKEVNTRYENFFGELYTILSQDNKDTPTRFMGNMGDAGPWKPLSEKWGDTKRSQLGHTDPLFYKGLTAALAASKKEALAAGLRAKPRRAGRGRAPRRSTKPFSKFLQELKNSSRARVKKFFGDLEIKYYISATGRKTPIVITQRQNIIESISKITSHGEKGRLVNNYNNVSLRADMIMFPLLRTAREFSEWYVVDQMRQADSSANKKQWQKINGRYGIDWTDRPIRPVITPLISWYAATLLPSILRKFY